MAYISCCEVLVIGGYKIQRAETHQIWTNEKYVIRFQSFHLCLARLLRGVGSWSRNDPAEMEFGQSRTLKERVCWLINSSEHGDHLNVASTQCGMSFIPVVAWTAVSINSKFGRRQQTGSSGLNWSILHSPVNYENFSHYLYFTTVLTNTSNKKWKVSLVSDHMFITFLQTR